MLLKHSYIIFHLLLLYCNIGENAVTSMKEEDNTSLRPAERACQEIIRNYKSNMDNYIVNGIKAVPGEFPHMVSLVVDLGKRGKQSCGGSLISPTYALTAAHCVDANVPDDRIIVRAGSLNIMGNSKFDPKTDMRAAQKIIHPEYKPGIAYHDIALLRLPSPVNTTANISPICLETNDRDPKGQLVVAGWGKTRRNGNGDVSSVLLKAYFVAVPQAKCKESYPSNRYKQLIKGITKEQLCAIDPKHKQDTCSGDSGGSLIVPAKDGRSRLVGVVSFGRGCGNPYPKVLVRVSSYIDWMEGIVWAN